MLSLTEIKEGLIFSVKALSVNKLRTFLSLMGVSIGIFAIISVFTMVDSIELSIRDLVSGLGDDIVFVQKWPQSLEEGEEEYPWWKYFSRREPSIIDMRMLKERIRGAEYLAFDSDVRRDVSFMNNSIEDCPLFITSSDFVHVYPLNIERGRFFSHTEFLAGRNVCLVGAEVAEDLFGSADPLNREIKVAGLKTSVIGVLEREGESIVGNNFDDVVITNVFFAKGFANLTETQNTIWVKAKEGISNDELKDEITGQLRAIHRLRPKEEKDFALNEISMLTNILDEIFKFFKIVALIIGMFSILVGGFGIANIMFVSVKERTKIIGIQKSLGAKQAFILIQFLVESVALSVIGGLLALLLIYILTLVASTMVDFAIVLTAQNIIIGLSISITIGVLAGIIPAWNASRLDPVVAIRSS